MQIDFENVQPNLEKEVYPPFLPVEASVEWRGRNLFFENQKRIIIKKVVIAFKVTLSHDQKILLKQPEKIIPATLGEVKKNKLIEESVLESVKRNSLFKEKYIGQLAETIQPHQKQKVYITSSTKCENIKFSHLELTTQELSQLFIYVKIEQPDTPLTNIKNNSKDLDVQIRHDNKIVKFITSDDIEGGHRYKIILEGESEEFSSLKARLVKEAETAVTFFKVSWISDFIYAATKKNMPDPILMEKIMKASHIPLREYLEKTDEEIINRLIELIDDNNKNHKKITEMHRLKYKIIPLESFKSLLISLVKMVSEPLDHQKIDQIIEEKKHMIEKDFY